MKLTGHQVRQLNDMMGDDYESDVTIEELPDLAVDEGGVIAIRPAGLYAWLTEYPEEGCTLLDEEPEGT